MGTSLIQLTAQRGRVRLTLHCVRMGEDLCVTLSGGDREHIGAVALGAPATPTSVLALPGHREDELAQRIASQVASHLGVVVAVACGIHVDAILPRELKDVLDMADELTLALLERLSAQKG